MHIAVVILRAVQSDQAQPSGGISALLPSHKCGAQLARSAHFQELLQDASHLACWSCWQAVMHGLQS